MVLHIRHAGSVDAGFRSDRDILIIAIGIVLLAVFSRLYHLGFLPLWIDEALSEWYSRQSLRTLWVEIPQYRNHPSLYWVLLKGWVGLFGRSEAGLRSLSAVFSLMTLPLAYWLGRECSAPGKARSTGMLCGLLFALSPLHVQYAQETRPYSALALAGVTALLGLVLLLKYKESWYPEDDGAGTIRIEDKADGTSSPTIAWGLLTSGTAGVIWFHNIGWLQVWSVLVPFTSTLLRGGRYRNPRLLLHLGSTCALVGILYLPFVAQALRQFVHVEQSFWVDPITVGSVWSTARTIWGGSHGLPAVMLLTLALLASNGVRSVARSTGQLVAAALLAAATLPFLASLALSIVSRPILVPRTLLLCNVPLLTLACVGAVALSDRYTRQFAIFAMVALSLFGVADYHLHYSKEPWHTLVARVLKNGSPSDVVLTIPNYAAIPFSYYLKDAPAAPPVHGLPRPFPAPGLSRPYPTGFAAAPAITSQDARTILELTRDARQVWLVTNRADLYDPQSLAVATLKSRFTLEETLSIGPTLHRFRMPESQPTPAP